VSDPEESSIIQVGHDIGLQKSLTDGKLDKAGNAGFRESTRRTSAWCNGCAIKPLITGVPSHRGADSFEQQFGESLQLLRYEEGQFYKIPQRLYSTRELAASRVYVVFFYLSDVEDRGGTGAPRTKSDEQQTGRLSFGPCWMPILTKPIPGRIIKHCRLSKASRVWRQRMASSARRYKTRN
jgi:hypothetical protein